MNGQKTIKFWWFFSFAGSWLKIVGNKFEVLMGFGSSFDVTEQKTVYCSTMNSGMFVDNLKCFFSLNFFFAWIVLNEYDFWCSFSGFYQIVYCLILIKTDVVKLIVWSKQTWPK